MNIDYLIIGQGLAGSLLCHSLLKRGYSVKVIDESRIGSASKAAAGIFNPITGRIMRKTWMAEDLFDFLPSFYRNLEKELNSAFFFPMPVLRMYISQEQQNDWLGQFEKPSIYNFVDESPYPNPNEINAPLGYFKTNQSGYVDVPKLIEVFRSYLLLKGILMDEPFDYDTIEFKPDAVIYKGIECRKILFCEGHFVDKNPFFQYLPIVPNKGEMLEVSIPSLSEDHIYNKNGFLLPRGGQVFWMGSTYHRNFDDINLSEKGKIELESKLKNITNADYQTEKAIIGIRPTVKDRKPLIGLHPKNEQIGIFNGLGSKGVSLAPYWAEKFVDFLQKGEDLSPEVNISRYKSLYSLSF